MEAASIETPVRTVPPAPGDTARIAEGVVTETGEPATQLVQWSAVVAGALIAAAVSLVLITFGSAIGLSVASTTPTWRDASWALALTSGLYLLLTAVTAFGLGGYVVGRVRGSWGSAAATDVVEFRDRLTEFRDGMNGVLAWAIAVVVSGLVVAATTATLTTTALRPTVTTANTSASESLIAYDLDRLFRADRRPVEGDVSYNRAEAGRILLTAAGRQGIQDNDRAYLVRLVELRTGAAEPDAERRVDNAIQSATTAVHKARRSVVILGFSIAVSLLLGAVVAWSAAEIGGRHRDDVSPPLTWRFPRRVLPDFSGFRRV